MSNHISIEALTNVPHINNGDDVARILLTAAQESGYAFQNQDVVCVASKAVSMAEGREVDLRTIEVSVNLPKSQTPSFFSPHTSERSGVSRWAHF